MTVATWWNPDYNRPGYQPPQPRKTVVPRKREGETDAAILEAIRDGANTSALMAAKTGLSARNVSFRLWLLRKRGLVDFQRKPLPDGGRACYWRLI